MVGLSNAQGLRQGEVLEFMKIAASQQGNPPKALKDMVSLRYYFSILVVSCFIWSSALDSSHVSPSYPIISMA